TFAYSYLDSAPFDYSFATKKPLLSTKTKEVSSYAHNASAAGTVVEGALCVRLNNSYLCGIVCSINKNL
ncbi:MAG: hypothetical protein SPK15_06060, partial [Candidatus Onthomorpha sp.]|nr:hypothetical protein [Candidatus Onthomorpha sp.]